MLFVMVCFERNHGKSTAVVLGFILVTASNDFLSLT